MLSMLRAGVYRRHIENLIRVDNTSSLAKRAPGYASLGFPDPRKLPYTASADTVRQAEPEEPSA
jgi:hypothetical protein